MPIKITEISPPMKVSGRSSFTIQFDFNQAIIDTLKSLPIALWHKKELLWEIPINEIREALDSLVLLDDIELKVLPDDSFDNSANLSEQEISEFKYTPFKHQIEAINYVLNHKKMLLLDSMGLGKTNEIIWTAETLKKRGLIDHCLVICGVDSLRSNWKNEIQKFSHFPVRVLGERITKTGKTVYDTISKRIEELKQPINEFFVVVNIATLRNEKIVEALKKGPNSFGLIAVDECHRIATKSSQQASSLLKLKSEYKIAATGTPITNSPLSAYVPLYWTENDRATLTNYKAQYCNFGGFNNSQITGYKNLDLLKDELDNCSIRRTFAQVRGSMPKKTVEYEVVEMSEEHAKFYEAIKDGVRDQADKIELNSNNLLALTTRLRQATSAPSVLTSQDIMSTKVERCTELAEELLSQGEKVMILCNFIDSAEKLGECLKQYNPIVCTGKQSADYISRGVDNFRNLPNFNILIGTHAKIGTGFSMPECHYMLILDTPFTAAQLAQSEDRIYRITSDQPVYIKILVCKNTIDERVRQIVETKQNLSDFLVDGVQNEFSDTLKSELTKIIREL